jgi:hypothetical protein
MTREGGKGEKGRECPIPNAIALARATTQLDDQAVFSYIRIYEY